MLKNSFSSDILTMLFKPKTFFANKLKDLSSQKIVWMSFICLSLGIILGNLISLASIYYVKIDFLNNNNLNYNQALELFNLSKEEFLTKLSQQQIYALVMLILALPIAYMGPHILGGALFIFLWIFSYENKKSLQLQTIIDSASLSLSFMFFSAIPLIGAFIAPILVGINLSRALQFYYPTLSKFNKIVAIVSAFYICFFLSSIALQALSLGIFGMIKDQLHNY